MSKITYLYGITTVEIKFVCFSLSRYFCSIYGVNEFLTDATGTNQITKLNSENCFYNFCTNLKNVGIVVSLKYELPVSCVHFAFLIKKIMDAH